MERPQSDFVLTAFSTLLRPLLVHLDKPSLPKYDGELALAGLLHPVKISWDGYAIPTVRAATEHDLFLAQGYLHAQERLWQMELARRFLSGRMAEIFGDFGLPWRELATPFRDRTSVDFDFFMRLLGIRHSAVASLGLYSDADRARLDAYCAGVNLYIERCGKRLPWEFRLLRHQPEPWSPADSLTVSKGLAFLLSTALFTRLNMLALADRLKGEPEKLRSLMPAYPKEAPAITRALATQLRGLWQFTSGTAALNDWHPAGQGSNSWAIAPHRSASGGTLLCNDPHLRMTMPATWYLMHLRVEAATNETRPYDVSGATIPGMPLVQIGRNRWIAWGITAALCDDIEIYREKLHPLEPDLYLFAHRWEKFANRRELIRVRGKAAIEKTVRLNHHGPVLSDFTAQGREREVLSVKWTAHEASRDLAALYGVNRAADWAEFIANLALHTAPSLNFTYADAHGNIGYSLAGKIPKRAAPPTLLPVDGWQEQNEWRGMIPFEELPRLLNPPDGVVASANNGIADSAYPHYLSHFFEPPQRFRRIHQLLAAREKHTWANMRATQVDDISLHAVDLISTIEADLTALAAEPGLPGGAAKQILQWNGRCSTASIGATIFHVFHHRLLANLLIPTLGEELFCTYVEILNQCLAPTDQILGAVNSPWFRHRTRKELVALALRQACTALTEKLGEKIENWRWGELHKLTMTHALSRIPLLSPLLSNGPLPAAGDGTTIGVGFYRHSHPYNQTVGASLRMVIDMQSWENCGWVLAAGQSGHPSSPHYTDQTNCWRAGELIKMAPVKSAPEDSTDLLLTPS